MLTVPVKLAVDGVTPTGVTIFEVEVVAGPFPTVLCAVTETVYSVPGTKLLTFTAEPIFAAETVVLIIEPEDTGVIEIEYVTIVAPPSNVEAPIVTAAVVAVGEVAITLAGAPGRTAFTPSVNVEVPVTVAPPVTVAVAVIVKVVEASATVGVPVISPVAVFSVSPAGNAPVTE